MSSLGPEQVELFYERGFVVRPGVFSESEVEDMRAAFDRLERIARNLERTCMFRGSRFVLHRIQTGERQGRVAIDRVVWCGSVEPTLARYGCDLRLLELVRPLLGSDSMEQLINQAHFKLPGDGVAFPWHQDSTHRRYGRGEWHDVNGRGSYVQTVVALDDVTESNGPLRFLPGTSRLGHVDLPPDGRLPREIAATARPVAPTMKAGSVLLFGPYVIHGSEPNRSRTPRRVLINGFACPGANSRVYPGAGTGRSVRFRS